MFAIVIRNIARDELTFADSPNLFFHIHVGSIQQLRGQNFAIFCPPPRRGQFLYPERGQKQIFFDPLPPRLVHVVIECPLIQGLLEF